jgi:hypothetical protein
VTAPPGTPQFRQEVVTLLGYIAEDVNEILEHLRWHREMSDGTLTPARPADAGGTPQAPARCRARGRKDPGAGTSQPGR